MNIVFYIRVYTGVVWTWFASLIDARVEALKIQKNHLRLSIPDFEIFSRRESF